MSLAAFPVAASAQSTSDLYAQRWVRALRSYFVQQYDPEFSLRAAQGLLISYGAYEGAADGAWGPATETAFFGVAQTMLAIGAGNPTATDPTVVTTEVINWLLAAVRSNILNTDFPD